MRPLYRVSTTDTCLSVDKETGFFVDFGTDEKGSLQKLIRMTTGQYVDFEYEPEPVKDLKDEIEIQFNKEEIKRLLPSYGFYNKRGISEQTLQHFQSGYCSHGKMYDRYVFPIVNPDASLVGLSGRKMRESSLAPKWKHLGPKTKFIYPVYFNKDIIQQSKEILLVESIGNMLALWECGVKNSLVNFGTSLSPKLLAAILSLNPNRILIGMDNDDKEDGSNPGQKGSAKIIQQLYNWFDKSQIACIVTPLGYDWGDLLQKKGKEEVLKVYESQI
jgi:DNA primase